MVGVSNPAPVAPPHALLAGCVTLTRARLLDVFGRTLDVPLANVATPTRATLAARPGALALRAAPAAAGALAVPPRRCGNARRRRGHRGPRRPDRDRAAGQSGGRLRDARPPRREPRGLRRRRLADRRAAARAGERRRDVGDRRRPRRPGRCRPTLRPRTGAAGAGRLRRRRSSPPTPRRARARRSGRRRAARDRALSALLRAIDTTLWTVDTLRRARQRARRRPRRPADRGGARAAAAGAAAARRHRPLRPAARRRSGRAAEQDAARHAFPVRIGELTRSDDGVLGFFVDDDYSRFRLVDKAIAGTAAEAGRSRGQLGAVRQRRAACRRRAPSTTRTSPAPTTPTRCTLHIGQTVTLTHLHAPRRQGHADVGRAAAQGTRAGARLGRPGARGDRAVAAHRAGAGGDRPRHRGPGAPAEGVGVRQGPELPLARHAGHLAHRRDPRGHADRAAARHAGRVARRAGSAWRRQATSSGGGA